MALGWTGATSGFGSHVRNAKTFPTRDGRQMPAKAAEGTLGTANHTSSRPAFGFGSAKAVNGTRHRCSGLTIMALQNGLSRLRTFVMCFLTVVPGRFPGVSNGTPQDIASRTLWPPTARTSNAWRLGHTSSAKSGTTSPQPAYSRHVVSCSGCWRKWLHTRAVMRPRRSVRYWRFWRRG